MLIYDGIKIPVLRLKNSLTLSDCKILMHFFNWFCCLTEDDISPGHHCSPKSLRSFDDKEEEDVKPPTFVLVSPIQPKDERDRKVSFLKLDRRSSTNHWSSKQKSRRRSVTHQLLLIICISYPAKMLNSC